LFFDAVAAIHPDRREIYFLCIGTDRSTGDSFGPLTGTLLAERGFPNVIGTLEQPCDALSITEAVRLLPENATVIAVDACLGFTDSIGCFLVAEGPIRPAEALGKVLAERGRYSVAGVVNSKGPKPYFTLQTTSLRAVMAMARETADAAAAAWA
jgi:putative sporulation protein YyaC